MCFFYFCESARIIIFVNLHVFGAKKRNARFSFCESAGIIIFANLRVVGAKKQKCAESQICSTHKWKAGTPYCDRLSAAYSYRAHSMRMTRLIHVLCASRVRMVMEAL